MRKNTSEIKKKEGMAGTKGRGKLQRGRIGISGMSIIKKWGEHQEGGASYKGAGLACGG